MTTNRQGWIVEAAHWAVVCTAARAHHAIVTYDAADDPGHLVELRDATLDAHAEFRGELALFAAWTEQVLKAAPFSTRLLT